MGARIATRLMPMAAALLLSGCLSLGGKVPEQLIDFTAERPAPAGPIAAGNVANAIVVLDPDADSSIDVQRVAVQINASAVAYLKDAQYVERPTRLFRRLVAETIRSRGRLVLEESSGVLSGGSTLSGRLVEMGYNAPSQSVVVRFDAIRQQASGAVQSQRFESRVPGVAADARTVGPALNRAANDVARQVADWIG